MDSGNDLEEQLKECKLLIADLEVMVNDYEDTLNPKPLPQPNGQGWWAFDGAWSDIAEQGRGPLRHVLSVLRVRGVMYAVISNDLVELRELSGEWTKLNVPWGDVDCYNCDDTKTLFEWDGYTYIPVPCSECQTGEDSELLHSR